MEVKNFGNNLTSDVQNIPEVSARELKKRAKEAKMMSLSNLKEMRANRKVSKSL